MRLIVRTFQIALGCAGDLSTNDLTIGTGHQKLVRLDRPVQREGVLAPMRRRKCEDSFLQQNSERIFLTRSNCTR
jgi:hypothetical protein